MIMKNDIIAVVIWYNPTHTHVENILSYIHNVRRVIIIDNSSRDNSHLLLDKNITTCMYRALYKNYGIATALNIGCKEAIENKAKWILTMDQDSYWDQEQLNNYFVYVRQYPNRSEVGVFSPYQVEKIHSIQSTSPYEDKLAAMTSGCLLSATGFIATNGFREDFFIDEVDDEYCMHIRQLGMRVITITNAFLIHQLGEIKKIKLFGILKKEYANHPPYRYYYMVRNNLKLSQLYPMHKTFNNKRLRKIIKRILLYDQWHKCASIRMCFKGWRDYRKGVMGELIIP